MSTKQPAREPRAAERTWSHDQFQRAFRQAGASDEDVGRLWTLHVGDGRSTGWTAQELLAELAEWTLFRSSVAGDDGAARAFERRWRTYVASFCRGRASRDEVDELTARFFERAFRLVDGAFRWQCPFTVYLRALLLNLARDGWERDGRRLSRERRLEEAVLAPQTARHALERSPEARVLSDEEDERVRRAVARLSEVDRAVVMACLVEGRTGSEVAAALGIARHAVYQRLHRARKRLQALLGDAGPRGAAPSGHALASGGRR